MESYIAYCLETGVTLVSYSFNELLETTQDIYCLKRKKKSKSTGDRPSGTAKPPTKIARTYDILRNTMGPEAEVVGSGSTKSVEVFTS